MIYKASIIQITLKRWMKINYHIIMIISQRIKKNLKTMVSMSMIVVEKIQMMRQSKNKK